MAGRNPNRPWIIALAALGLIALFSSPATASPMITSERERYLRSVSYLGKANLPRGLRNNNPGNIRVSNNPWQGKIPLEKNTDKAFEQFDFYVFGVRAMIILVRNYMEKHGLNTVRKILERYAPPNENHTGKYTDTVARWMGITPDTPLTATQKDLRPLIKALARYETGMPDAVDDEMFTFAYALS